jgi:folate-dependent phosphoribosylglycinamide formyltransferase PurN
VNAHFDKGEIVAQFHTPIAPDATLKDVEASIRYLEHSYLPTVVEHTLLR